MEAKVEAPSSTNGVIKHIFNFDGETKSNLLNLTQYTVLAVIPVAILQNIGDYVFPKYDQSKGSMELLAEILGQSLLTLIGLFFIHRLITAIPTWSGTAMGDLNLFSIMMVFLLTSFTFNGRIEEKIKELSKRVLDLWNGKKDEGSDDKKKTDQSKVTVSQPISRGGMPTHQASRADYIGMHSNMAPPPPPQQTQHPDPGSSGNYAINNTPVTPPPVQEPMAYNMGGGSLGGAAW